MTENVVFAILCGNSDKSQIMLRCVQIGLSIRDLDLLTIGMVNEMFIENQNDDVADKVYKVQASQHDRDMF